MRNIANTLNISTTTISFILNGKSKEKGISDTLTKRVLDYIEQINYKIDHRAHSLRTGKTGTIGLIIERISDFFFSNLAYHIEKIAYENNYKIVYGSTDNCTKTAKEHITMMYDRRVDGFIIVPTEGVEEDIEKLINENLPVVLLDRYCNINCSHVIVNNAECTYNAIQYLINSGYKNIAFVTVDINQSQMIDRKAGYIKGLFENNLNPYILTVPFSNYDRNMEENLSLFINTNSEIDAIFFSTNYLALSGLKIMRRINKNIPEDLAVIVFDDHECFEIGNPSITAIAQPIQEISNAVLNTLLKKINDPASVADVVKVVVPGKLHVRGSVIKSDNNIPVSNHSLDIFNRFDNLHVN